MLRNWTRDRRPRSAPGSDGLNAGRHLLLALLVVFVAMPPGHAQDAGGNAAGSNGSEAGAVPGGGSAIDTRMAAPSGSSTGRHGPASKPKTPGIPTTPTNSMHHQAIPPGAGGESARNAVGVPITNPTGGPATGAHSPTVPAVIPPSPVGAQGGFNANLTARPMSRAGTSPTAAIPAAGNHAVISGTGMTHSGIGPGLVRGTVAIAAGSISGTSFRPRH